MRLKPFAIEIISDLHQLGFLETGLYSDIRSSIPSDNPSRIFNRVYFDLHRRGWSVGWNKTWRGGVLLAWYGAIVTSMPMRAAAIEFRNFDNPDLDHFALADHGNSGDTVEFSNRYAEEKAGARTNLLRRINLDQREQPFVERWHWSERVGSAVLSDEGRFQVSRELVWSRAIEHGLVRGQGISAVLRKFLQDLDRDEPESSFPTETDACLLSCLKCLEFYGFAKKMGDRIRFARNPGCFPELALELWKESSG